MSPNVFSPRSVCRRMLISKQQCSEVNLDVQKPYYSQRHQKENISQAIIGQEKAKDPGRLLKLSSVGLQAIFHNLATNSCRIAMLLTSKGGGKQEVSAVLFDQVFSNLLQVGSPPQEADVPDELRGKRQWQTEEVLPFQSQAVHFPTGELPGGKSQGIRKSSLCFGTRGIKCAVGHVLPPVVPASSPLSPWLCRRRHPRPKRGPLAPPGLSPLAVGKPCLG